MHENRLIISGEKKITSQVMETSIINMHLHTFNTLPQKKRRKEGVRFTVEEKEIDQCHNLVTYHHKPLI
jgi:hypothetical protein